MYEEHSIDPKLISFDVQNLIPSIPSLDTVLSGKPFDQEQQLLVSL